MVVNKLRDVEHDVRQTLFVDAKSRDFPSPLGDIQWKKGGLKGPMLRMMGFCFGERLRTSDSPGWLLTDDGDDDDKDDVDYIGQFDYKVSNRVSQDSLAMKDACKA